MLREKMKFLREMNEMKQKDVAAKLNIDRSTYSYYETGKTTPHIRIIIKISEIFDVTPNYLMLDSINVYRYKKHSLKDFLEKST